MFGPPKMPLEINSTKLKPALLAMGTNISVSTVGGMFHRKRIRLNIYVYLRLKDFIEVALVCVTVNMVRIGRIIIIDVETDY